MLGGTVYAGLEFRLEDIAKLNLLHRSIHIACVEDARDLKNRCPGCLTLNPFDCERRTLPQLGSRGSHRSDCIGHAVLAESEFSNIGVATDAPMRMKVNEFVRSEAGREDENRSLALMRSCRGPD